MKYQLTGAAALALLPFAAWSTPEACDAATGIDAEGVTITSAAYETKGEESPLDHCVIQATIAERTGTDGKPYAIRFELRLPDTWNGALMHQFNGGADGKVVPALGTITGLVPGDGALARGMAVVSSDAGHDETAYAEAGLAGGNTFGLEFEARKNYGYGAVPQVQSAAEALTTAYYDSEITHRYGMGASNGGRHAMVAASRMGDTFDGLIAAYPGYNLPRAGVQLAWLTQHLLSVSETVPGAFSREEMGIVSAGVTEACDALDGSEDGLVMNPLVCQAVFDPKSITCADGQNSACLPPEKVEALTMILSGAKNSAGEQLASPFPWDPGLSSGNWRFWNLESPVPPWEGEPLGVIIGGGSLAQVFTTPPTAVGPTPSDLRGYLAAFDFDEDAPKIYATSEAFPESAMDLSTPPDKDDPKLDAFVAHGGKLVIFHGTADPVFSVLDTAAWVDRFNANLGDAAADHVVFYPVPGMPHGQGGPSADSFDTLTVLTDWVENDVAPGPVTATVRPENEEAPEAVRGETRPLCPYPSVARASDGAFACE